MTTTTTDVFQELWDLLPHPADGWVNEPLVTRLMAKKGDEVQGDFARTASELRRFAQYWGERLYNVYVSPNPCFARAAGVRHSAKDVSHWSYFLIDMDPVEKEYDAAAALDEALLWLGEWMGRDFSLNPPLTIDSGRGRQAWIRLPDVPLDARYGREGIVGAADCGGGSTNVIHPGTARAVNGYWLKRLDERLGLVHGCRIDTSVADLCRPMRCPGTANAKTGRMASFVHRTGHVFQGLETLLTVGTPKEATAAPPPVVARPGLSWQKAVPMLTLTAQRYLLSGWEEPGRHKTMFHTAKKLQELGCSRETIRRALTWANGLRGEENELEPKDIEHALDSAFKEA